MGYAGKGEWETCLRSGDRKTETEGDIHRLAQLGPHFRRTKYPRSETPNTRHIVATGVLT